MAGRRTLHFSTPADVAADIQQLRAGYQITGHWNLPQVCFHLDKLMATAMTNPPAETTDEQIARRPVLDKMLATGQIPSGLVSPDPFVPPANTPESAIDDFLKTLETFAAFNGTFAPHRLFGNISADERRRHQMIHCAHHLSYLVPAEPVTT